MAPPRDAKRPPAFPFPAISRNRSVRRCFVMSSPKQPNPPAPEGAVPPILAAVSAVAEQSFFAMVDGGDEHDADQTPNGWLVAMIRFDDGHTSGSLACWVPPDLAQTLFDSFSGRDPSAPPPPAHEIYDLIGEFSNMVCGD